MARYGEAMTKPDRFARAVAKSGIANEPSVEVATKKTIALLRREHKAVVRLVKILHDKRPILHEDNWGYWLACDDLLAALERRRK